VVFRDMGCCRDCVGILHEARVPESLPHLLRRSALRRFGGLTAEPAPNHRACFPCATEACREGYRGLYFRLSRLFQDLAIARGDGRYDKLLRTLARTHLLVLDDWGTAPLTDEQRRDLFEVTEDRYDRGSTLIAAQLPTKHWHETIGAPTLADAILDRLVHNAYTITLKGESMRKRKAKNLTTTTASGKKTKDN